MSDQVRHLKVHYLLGAISKAELCAGLERIYRKYWFSPEHRVAQCGQLMGSMRQMIYEPAKSKRWTPDRRNYINDIAQRVRITGGQVRPEL